MLKLVWVSIMLYQPLLKYGTPYIIKKSEEFCSFPLHLHHQIELLYCLEGAFVAKLNGEQYHIHAGELLFISSMTDHELIGDKSCCKFILIEFGPMLLREKFRAISEVEFACPVFEIANTDKKPYADIYASIKTMLKICEETDSAADLLISGELYKISAYMVSLFMNSSDTVPSEKVYKRKIEGALELIYLNYNSNISIDDAAKITGYSKSNFCRNFKLATGTSFHQYLAQYRISNACYILRTTDYSIEKISESVGFSETRSFCRSFKKIMRMTPLEYRKR